VLTVFAGDLRTGKILTPRALPVDSAHVDLTLNEAGSIRATLDARLVDEISGSVINLPRIIKPTKCFIAVSEKNASGETILAAGPIWTDGGSLRGGKLTWAATGLRGIFDYRFVLPVLTSGQLPRDVSSTWTTSLRTLAKKLVQAATAATGGDLPIVLEDDITGTIAKTYQGSDLVKISQALSDLSGTDGGPDIDFRPRFKTDRRYIEWEMVTGTPLVQSGDDLVWDATVPGSGVTDVQWERDGTALSTTDYETGATVDDVILEALSEDTTLTTAGYPRMETAAVRGSVTDSDILQAQADGTVATGKSYLESVTLTVEPRPETDGIKGGPWIGSYHVGDMLQLVLPDSAWAIAARYRHRIVGLSADLSGPIALTCAPERTTGQYPSPVSDQAWLGSVLKALSVRVDEATRGR